MRDRNIKGSCSSVRAECLDVRPRPVLSFQTGLNIWVSFFLLKCCPGVCKVNYLLRVTPVLRTTSGAHVFDELVEKSLHRVVGGVTDTEIFRELQLPTEVNPNCQDPLRRLGLTSATTTAASAFLSCAASCNALVGNELGSRTLNELSTSQTAKKHTKPGMCCANENLSYHFKIFVKFMDI